MSSVEPAVAVKNLLYSNWSIAAPGKDVAKADTLNPAQVHFTVRKLATVPLRTHTFQLSIVPGVKAYRPIQIGNPTKYRVDENLSIHIFILTGPKQSLETAYTNLYAIQTEVRRIIRKLGETAGSGIQHILLGPWRDRSDLDREPPRLHVEAMVIPILFETS